MDVVITYVDDTEGLRKEYAQYCKKDFQENRFRSYGVLDLQVRGIRKYMPYVKNIFIVVNYKIQVKDYDFTGLDVKIIEHRQIIPKLFLPCFNSCAIEMFLHNIPNLDEEFVYFNDDCFVINDSPYECWFKDSKPCLHPTISKMNEGETNAYRKNLYNSTNLVCSIFSNGLYASGKYIIQEHCPRPFLKSTIKTVWAEAGNEIKKSLTRLRNSKNYNATLFNDYDYLNDNYCEYKHNYLYFNVYDTDKYVKTIIQKSSEIVCINDEAYIDIKDIKCILHDCLYNNINGFINNNVIKEEVKIKPINKKSYNIAVCATTNEIILSINEWVNYYKRIGVSHVYLLLRNHNIVNFFTITLSKYIQNGFVSLISNNNEIDNEHNDVIYTDIGEKDEKIIVSLTSYPARIIYVNEVILSLINQSLDKSKYKIILTLSKTEFQNLENDLPSDLLNTIHSNNIEIIWTKTNIKSHKKLIPVIEKYPYNDILICDDDITRPYDWVETFYDDHIKYPSDIICGKFLYSYDVDLMWRRLSGFKMRKAGQGNNVDSLIFSFARPSNGSGGILYPSYTFMDKRFYSEKLFMNISPTSDESWQYCFNIIENKVLRQLSKIYDDSSFCIDGTQKMPTCLYKQNKTKYIEINKLLLGYFPEYKRNIIKRQYDDVIVSLTSYKDRLHSVKQVIDSLLNQTISPFKILLVVYKDDVIYIPDDLKNYINDEKIELIITNEDIAPHKKYFYAMLKYPTHPIITVDDDICFDSDMIESLINSYIKYPNCISARRVHKIKWYDHKGAFNDGYKYDVGFTRPYKKWQYECKSEINPSYELFSTNGAGTLYPPNILNLSIDNLIDIRECKYADDIYIKWLANKRKIRIVWVPNDKVLSNPIKNVSYTQNALYKQNVIGINRNDLYLRKFKLEQHISEDNNIIYNE